MHAFVMQTSSQAFRLRVTLPFITKTHVSIPVMANDTVKPTQPQIRDTICQIEGEHGEGAEGCQMDFFVKGETFEKVIITEQEVLYVNTFTLNPSLDCCV